ncbi:MAG TPA: hypothetical protein VII76_09135 [Acidimicrobiales bacterium]
MGPGHHHHPDTPHDHGHIHGPGAEGPGAESPLGPSGEASVVLDIGPHAGALVLYTDEGLAGAEIEIRPGDGTWLGAHTAVRARHAGGRVLYAGVFGSLAPGRYDLRLKGGGGGSFDLTVDVVAGTVTEARVPTTPTLSGVSLG